MGWKLSTIIINNPATVDHKQILSEMGLSALKKINDETFEVAMNANKKQVFIGSYKENLLICTPNIPISFLKKELSETETFLNNRFPNSEICSIVLHSTVNLWGFSISKNGEKLRLKLGSSIKGTLLDHGNPLKEEMELLNKATTTKNRQRIYLLDDDEALSEDQVGENFVFAISKRYFGVELDKADELLFETTLEGYTYEEYTKSKKSNIRVYIGVVILLVIWQILKRTVLK